MHRRRSITICSCAMPRSRACFRTVGCPTPPPRSSVMLDRSSRASLLAVALACAPFAASAADYTQAAGSTLQFTGSYQGDAFSGRFPGFATTLRFDPKALATSRLDVAIPITTVTTGNEDYDSEMRGAAFFDSK